MQTLVMEPRAADAEKRVGGSLQMRGAAQLYEHTKQGAASIK